MVAVLMHHEQAAPPVTSVFTSSVARHFPTSVLLQEQRDEYKPLLHMFKEDKAFQVRYLSWICNCLKTSNMQI
jgi:hypothetical protein